MLHGEQGIGRAAGSDMQDQPLIVGGNLSKSLPERWKQVKWSKLGPYAVASRAFQNRVIEFGRVIVCAPVVVGSLLSTF